MNNLYRQSLRIYGDNVLECEKTLNILINSISLYHPNAVVSIDQNSNLFCPQYIICTNNLIYKIQLFPGYKRWSSNILDKLTSLGASLNEGADSIVTSIENLEENIIFGCEYCGALPAGNNAWQRSGRALLFAEANIPFLYYSELGGMELDSNRNLKAGRLPNPLVPFSYITVNYNYTNSLIVPIYKPSPTISRNNFFLYNNCFSTNEDLHLIYNLLVKDIDNTKSYRNTLLNKALNLTKILLDNRKNHDTISSNKLLDLLKKIQNNASHELLENLNENWEKNINIDLTSNVKYIYNYCLKNGLSMGSNSMPFCMISTNNKVDFLSKLTDLNPSFHSKIENINNSQKTLAVLWIAGFKPRGDDSRPDRGLIPLFKMLYGNEYTILTIVFGPMKLSAIKDLKTSPTSLSKNNGLWRAIFAQSDYVLIDNYAAEISPLQTGVSIILDKTNFYYDFSKGISYKPCTNIPNFGEHDVDSTIHSIFRTNFSNSAFPIFECLCNPPGGDWSGIKLYDYQNKLFYRWSSLPRVSGRDKRPDHLIQFNNVFLVIESKFDAKTIESNIGLRLKNYVAKLLKTEPNSVSNSLTSSWTLITNSKIDITNICLLSVAAYNLDSLYNINNIIQKSNTDIIFAFTFNNHSTSLYIKCKNSNIENWLKNILSQNPNLSTIQLNIQFK
ncbi:hypothetical protein [Clostridium tyrobutyricum]|uniref:hypothetical protein n=1 Tax=Clostridium tyrobutyricum TaxID=1519 RepID=UPI00189D1D6D|nr:hypothetical protein [Clostridium tyrobutyricum]